MIGVLLRLLLLGTMLTLSACQTTRTTGTIVDTSCSAFRPITYSASQDTPETVAEIRAHNRAFAALCD